VTDSEFPSSEIKRPRVALVAHGIHDHGGMEKAYAELIRHAHARYDFTVIAADLAPELRPLARWVRVRVPSRPIPLKSTVFLVLAGLRLRSLRADLVHVCGAIVPNHVDLASIHHCHAGFRASTGALAPRGAPWLRRVNTSIERLLALAAERWCYRPSRTRCLAAVSAGVAGELERFYPGIPVVFTPNGTDLERFSPSSAERQEFRTEVGVSDKRFVALFVGGNWDLKGLEKAIQSVAAAVSRGVECELWVVGRGDTRRFQELAQNVGVVDHVRFFGPRRDPERFFRAADALVLPSGYETFSLVAYEAAASGLPVIATAVNGIAEVVGDDEAGFIVDRDAEAVASALQRLAVDKSLRARVGSAARRRAMRYSWEASVESVMQAYDRLLRERTLEVAR